ncbi:MAG: acyl-CoA dehydrogenase family protein [Dehalococcoidia bacterium]
MNLDFSEDQKLLRNTVREYLAEQAPRERIREFLEGSEPRHDVALWKAAGDMGWLGAALPETFGGAGGGYLELAVIAEELGRVLAPIPVSSSVYLASEAIQLAGSDAQRRHYLPLLASGELIGTFSVAEPAGRSALQDIEARYVDGLLYGCKAPVPDGILANVAVVAARGKDDALTLVLVDLTGPGVERRPLRHFDGSRFQAVIEFSGASAELLAGSDVASDLVPRLFDQAAVLIAFEQLGGAEACLDMAREYTGSRFAFGRPIGSFQALKHRMADMYTSVELARSNCYYGAWALSTGSDELPVAACIARISATEAYRFCAEENLHLHGGVGCTWEYDCHLYLRRANLLAQSLGPIGGWKERLVRYVEANEAREAGR